MRVFAPGLVGTALAVLLIAIGLIVVMGREDLPPGEIWSRSLGLLSGEELRLMKGGRYRLEFSRCLGTEAVEHGTWSKFGDAVSLVPSTPGASPRVLRQVVEDQDWLLYEPRPDGSRPHREEHFERRD